MEFEEVAKGMGFEEVKPEMKFHLCHITSLELI